MKIKLNPDMEIVNTIREGLKKTGGYCPCPEKELMIPSVCVRSSKSRSPIPISKAFAIVCSTTRKSNIKALSCNKI